MTRTISGEEFEQLYRATVQDLAAYVRRRIGDGAEDVVAETYVVAWRRRANLPNPGFRRAWLFGVARNLVLTHHRERVRDAVTRGMMDQGVAPTPADISDSDERGAIVLAALQRLKPDDQEILRLQAWEGLTTSEIAVALNLRPATVRVRLHRARQRLAEDPALRALPVFNTSD